MGSKNDGRGGGTAFLSQWPRPPSPCPFLKERVTPPLTFRGGGPTPRQLAYIMVPSLRPAILHHYAWKGMERYPQSLDPRPLDDKKEPGVRKRVA